MTFDRGQTMTLGVRKAIKRGLERYPPLYALAVKATYSMRPVHMLELARGTEVREREWARRHLRGGGDWGTPSSGDAKDDWIMSYWASREHCHRSFLLDRISRYSPLSSVLELGCNCGPNLYLAAKRFPRAKFVGIDINAEAVRTGQELLASDGISNVRLLVGRADDLKSFGDNSFDVVFSDAVLMYIGRDKIRDVVRNMVRVARRAVVLLEWQHDGPAGDGRSALGHRWWGCWRRDYVTLLSQYAARDCVRVVRVTEGMWPDERWSQAGAIIEARLDGVEECRP